MNTIPLLKKTWARHTAFWLMFVLVNGFVWGYCGEMNPTFFRSAFTFTLAELPFLLLAVYFNLYVLLPRFFLSRKYGQYAVLTSILCIATAVCIRAVFYYGFDQVNNFKGLYTSFLEPYYLGKLLVLHVCPVFVVSMGIKLWQQWYQQQRLTQELQREKLDAELKFLKAQIHPHFLFNTLNNLYSLALQKSDKTPEMLLKLSDLMSYMLYDAQEHKIELEKELRHIRNYIALEQLRYGNRLVVKTNISGEVHGKYVAPLVLMPFVENAFKHGASSNIDQAWIVIDIEITEQTLWVKVENSQSLQEGETFSQSKGIGLINVKRRLNLMYPNHFDLKTEKQKESYAVDLKVQLI